MRSEDKPNEYFEDYSFLQNQSHNSRGGNFFFSENSLMVDFKEPLSLCYSDNDGLMHQDSDIKQQPTGIPTKTIPFGQQIQELPLKQEDNRIKFDQETISNYKAVYQGTKNDTVELNTNFKTILVNYLKQLILANELNQQQVQHITEFIGRVPSFQSLKMLFKQSPQNEGVRKICMTFFSSSECMKRVLESRCKIKNKIQMIKFIEKIRINIQYPNIVVKWKDVIKPDNLKSQ